MELLKGCAEFLDQKITQWVAQSLKGQNLGNYLKIAKIFNAKVYLFNGCTAAVGISAILGFCNIGPLSKLRVRQIPGLF